MKLEKLLSDWAKKLAAKAAQNDTPLQESTDAFKAVTAYYAATKKGRAKSDDEDDEPGGFTFGEVAHDDRERPPVRTQRDS